MWNKKLKYSLERWDHDTLKYWKWHFSEYNNRLFARHEQVCKSYEISNGISRRNKGNYVDTTGICATPSENIKEIDFYKDWSYKIQSYICHQEQHLTSQDNVIITTLNEAKNQFPTEDRQNIQNM